MDWLPPRINAHSRLVVTGFGYRLAELPLVHNSYYADFYKMLTGDLDARVKFRDRLLEGDEELRAGTTHRAACAFLAKKYGIGYLEAIQLIPHHKSIDISYEDCVQIVIDNYMELMKKNEALAIIGKMDADGRIVIIEGHHRALINLYNNILKFPVVVVDRNQDWVNFVQFFKDESINLYGLSLRLYHQIDHPDFDSFEVIRENRSKYIIDSLLAMPSYKVGLDIGSMIGFNTQALASLGYKMTAIEYEAKYATAARRLRSTYGLDYEVCEINAREIFDLGKRFDFAIALSIIYHMMRINRVEAENFCRKLMHICNALFIDSEENTGVLTESDILDIFKRYRVDKIYSGSDGRSIYLIHKPIVIDEYIEYFSQ